MLVVARPLTDIAGTARSREAMFVVIPITLLLAGAGRLWLASIGLRRSRPWRGARPAFADRPGGSRRTAADDELGQLASAFNGLVSRLRDALQTQRQFMADASHELRTPVSVIRTAAEVTLSRAHRDEAEYREALTMAGAQARRLGTLVTRCWCSPRADAGAYPLRPSTCIWMMSSTDCRRAVGVLAADRGITVTRPAPPMCPFAATKSSCAAPREPPAECGTAHARRRSRVDRRHRMARASMSG